MVGLPDIWALFRRRLGLISSVVLACTLAAAVACVTLTKIYTATSTVVLERKDVRPFETDVANQAVERDKSAAETEMDVLRSRQFAGRIVDRMNLVNDPDFNPLIANQSNTSGPATILKSLLGMIGLTGDASQSQSNTPEMQRDRAISILLSQIGVSRSGESLAVNVAVASSRPDLAASIANTIASMYVESSLEFKQDVRMADKQRAMKTGGAVAFLRERIAQPLLITLRSEEARLAREKSELASRYGKNHPKIIDQDSQIASVRKMIDEEVQRILQDLEIEALKPSARTVSLAEIPTSPSFPKPIFIVPAAFFGSTLLAFMLALILEATDTRIRNGERTSRILQVANLGYVPRASRAKKNGTGNGGNGAVKRHNSLADESIRSVYLASRTPSVNKPPGVIMVTACLHDNASAATAWGIAAAGAADGRKAVFVDLDRPSSDEAVPGPVLDTVKRFLKNELSLASLIGEAAKRSGSTNPIDASVEFNELCRALSSKSLVDILTSLRRVGHDFVVLHAPPVLTVSDANWLAPIVDGVILTVAWGKTTEEQLVDAASQLRLNRARLIGTVIDEVDPRSQEKHRYGGTLKYYRQVQDYIESRA
jgi:uncharacterized protein involved in exopolysaccharide biosynthesis/Mrp family chromosome partitioning ATPase